MISISEVYDAVRDLANKDQKGFVTPAVFNTFANVAQQNIYNKLFDDLTKAQSLRRSNADAGRDKSLKQQIEEDLSYYLTERGLPEISPEAGIDDPVPDNYIDVLRPLDIKKIVSIRLSDRTRNSAEIVYDPDKINRINNSRLSKPTEEFPVAFVKGTEIQVFPDTIDTDLVQVLFYRQPRSVIAGGLAMGQQDLTKLPIYAVINVDPTSGFVIQDITNSRNFDLPEHYKGDLIIELCKLVGIRLRDSFITQATNLEESKQQ
jgi:hypothetical protein